MIFPHRETSSNENSLTHEPKKLSAPVLIGNNYSSTSVDKVSSALFNLNDRTFIKPTNDVTTVSQKKLEKAEAKLREKQEKRARDGAVNGENKLVEFNYYFFNIYYWTSREQARLEDAVVSQATNKRLLTDNESSDGSNKSYDRKKIFLIFDVDCFF